MSYMMKNLHFCNLKKTRDGRTDQPTYLPVEMQFYLSVMFLDLPDDKHEEKPLFKKNALDRQTNRRTDGPTDGQTDGRTDPLIEMRGRI